MPGTSKGTNIIQRKPLKSKTVKDRVASSCSLSVIAIVNAKPSKPSKPVKPPPGKPPQTKPPPAEPPPATPPASKPAKPPAQRAPSPHSTPQPAPAARPSLLSTPHSAKSLQELSWTCDWCNDTHHVTDRYAKKPFTRAHGYSLVQIAPDGDCFYAAVVGALSNDKAYIKSMKKSGLNKNFLSVNYLRSQVASKVTQTQFDFYILLEQSCPTESYLNFLRDEPYEEEEKEVSAKWMMP